MSWDDITGTGDNDARERHRQAHEAKLAALKQACARALASREQTELKEFLRSVALGFSYTSGRSAEDVAFVEGRRRLAIELLQLGEVIDE